MEFGSAQEDMVFDDFDLLEKELDRLQHNIENRKIMTASEQKKLEILKRKARFYIEIKEERKQSFKGKIDLLLSTYSTYYSG